MKSFKSNVDLAELEHNPWMLLKSSRSYNLYTVEKAIVRK